MPAWPSSSAGLAGRLQGGLLVALVLLHLFQLRSPLRLNTDAVIYVSLGHAAFSGAPLSFDGQAPHFPPGYPLLLAGLEWLGWLHPATLVALNLLALAVALASAHALLLEDHGLSAAVSGAAVLCALGSWVLVKHVSLPLSEMVYMALSLASLALLARVARAGGPGRAVAALGLILLAASVRYVGLTLFPAAAWAVVQRLPAARRSRALWLVALVVALGLAALEGSLMFIGHALPLHRAEWLWSLARTLGQYRLTECGELLLNLPLSRFEQVRYALFPPCGLVALVLLVRGRLAAWRGPRVCDIYLAGYLAALCAWPHYDPRLWLPVLPFFYAWLLAGISRATERRAGPAGTLARLHVVWYGALSFAALIFSVRLTLAGPRFPDEFGDGSLRAVYRAAWGQQSPPTRLDAVESAALDALQRIEPRARGGRQP